MTLVSDSEMAALQDLAESGMTTSASVYHETVTAGEGGRVAAYSATLAFTVLGWFTAFTGASARTGINAGEAGTAETYRLLVPPGTDIRNGDKVVVGGTTFFVQSTSAENTYQPYLAAFMRLFE